MKVEIHDRDGSPEAKEILAGIVAYNNRYREDDLRHLTAFMRDSAGRVSAGLTGYTDWGWLFVRLLWVSEELRGTGVGTSLMKSAEDEARRRGCTGAWLDTFGFQAPSFYKKLGYESFGELAEYPRGYTRHFLFKRL